MPTALQTRRSRVTDRRRSVRRPRILSSQLIHIAARSGEAISHRCEELLFDIHCRSIHQQPNASWRWSTKHKFAGAHLPAPHTPRRFGSSPPGEVLAAMFDRSGGLIGRCREIWGSSLSSINNHSCGHVGHGWKLEKGGSTNSRIRLIRWKMYQGWNPRNGSGSLRDLMTSRLGVRSKSPSRLTDYSPFPTPCYSLISSSKQHKALPVT
jgi:hypothetical protein